MRRSFPTTGTSHTPIGEYHPDVGDVFASLTDRQQEIVATAIREGYYEDPRRASQADVAATLGIATGTVSEHLRRIEATVFSEYVLDRCRTTAGRDASCSRVVPGQWSPVNQPVPQTRP